MEEDVAGFGFGEHWCFSFLAYGSLFIAKLVFASWDPCYGFVGLADSLGCAVVLDQFACVLAVFGFRWGQQA